MSKKGSPERLTPEKFTTNASPEVGEVRIPDMSEVINNESVRKKLLLDNIAKNIALDKEYANRVFTDFHFATEEFSKAGITLDPEVHRSMQDGYLSIARGSSKILGDGAGPVAISVSVHVKW